MIGKVGEPPESRIPFEIGRVVMASARLEEAVAEVCVVLINDDLGITRLVTVELSYEARVALALNLYCKRHGEDDHFSELKAIIHCADDAIVARNQIVHSTWFSAGAESKVTRVKASAKRKGAKISVENMTDVMIGNVADDIDDARNRLLRWIKTMIEKGKVFSNNSHDHRRRK